VITRSPSKLPADGHCNGSQSFREMSVAIESATLECILIADDLTGACDTGVQFARSGLTCRVELNFSSRSPSANINVLTVNTNSRGDRAEESQRKIEDLAAICSRMNADVICKKIDSTLRGNVGKEITTTLRAFDCEAAIIAPAYPAMRRLVRDGILDWDDGWDSGQIAIQELLEKQGVPPRQLAAVSSKTRSLESDLAGHFKAGRSLLVMDSCCQQDLHRCVAAGSALPHRILWVGCAGLGIALAQHMAKPGAAGFIPHRTDAPMLFVVGSTHPSSVRQRQGLRNATDALEIPLSADATSSARQALSHQRHLLVVLERGKSSKPLLRRFFEGLCDLRLAGLFLTGGDTATAVCDAIGAQAIDLYDEILPGLPWGILRGGIFDGLPVATKSGSFGDQAALVGCADFFAAARKVPQ
jgi:D-threonate/D-erythronate kinase